MSWYWWLLIGIYVVGFGLTFWFNAMLGMITFGLALLRAIVWPIHWLTGWPAGERLPMD